MLVYQSPGKHHFYSTPDPDYEDDDLAVTPYACNDPHGDNTLGVIITDQRLVHAPVKATEADVVGNAFVNLCERDTLHISPTPAVNLMSLALPGDLHDCTYWEEHFCDGGSAVGSATISDASINDDLDGDGLANSIDPCPTKPTPPSTNNTKCAQLETEASSDGVIFSIPLGEDCDFDGIPDHCDPAPKGRNRYVAGGVAGEKWTDGAQGGAQALRGGFADFDGDNSADGYDVCPGDPGVTEGLAGKNNWNLSSEELNVADRVADVPGGDSVTLGAKVGFLKRGNACDPYPVTKTRFWNDYAKGASKHDNCNTDTSETQGAVLAPLDIEWHAGGYSANGAQSGPPRQLALQALRCECAPPDTGCLSDQASSCYRGKSRPDNNGGQAWRGWRSALLEGCQTDSAGECPALALTQLAGSTGKEQQFWDWTKEKDGYPNRFAPNTFITAQSLKPYPKSQYLFAVQGIFVEQTTGPQDYLNSPPGSTLPHNTATALYPEPDQGDAATKLKIATTVTDQSRRLRGSVEPGELVLQGEHFALVNPTPCVDWHGYPEVFWLPYPPDSLKIPELYTDPLIWGVGGPQLEDIAVLAPTQRSRKRLTLSVAANDWVRGAGLSAPTRVSERIRAQAVPEMMWVSLGERPLFARLVPTAQTPTAITYEKADEGALPLAVHPTATQMVSDAQTGFVAIVNTQTGEVQAYEPVLARWFVTNIPSRQLTDASFALSAGTLVGSSPSGAFAHDVIDGRFSAIPLVPSRRKAVVTMLADSRTVTFVGGIDAASAAHDDVWTYSLSRPLDPAVRTRGDTVLGRVVRGEAVVDPADGRSVTVLQESTRVAGFVAARTRTDEGWRSEEPGRSSACASTDPLGGRLCPLATDPWHRPGHLTCVDDTPPNACLGAQTAASPTRTLPGTVAINAVASAEGVWTLRKGSLERRDLTATLQDRGVRTATLQKAIDFDATPEGALVATKTGLVFARDTGTAVSVSSTTALCGSPVRVTHTGPSSWAVMTNTAIALVTTQDGTPKVTQQALLKPRPGDDDDWELAFLVPGASLPARCKVPVADAPVDNAHDRSFLARGEGDLFAVRGPFVGRLRVESDAFEIARLTIAPDQLMAVRYDEVGKRVYATGKHNTHVFDVRNGGLTRTAGHSVSAWVTRSDAGSLSARIDAQGRVVVARATP